MNRFARVKVLSLAAAGLLLATSPSGAQWSPTGAPVCVHPAFQSHGGIVTDGAGGAYVAWVDGRNHPPNELDIYVQHITASGAIAPGWPVNGFPVCRALNDQWVTGITADGEGGVIVTWQDDRTWYQPDIPFPYSRDIYAQRITAAGAIAPGWQLDGVPVSTLYANRMLPRVASDGAGGAFVAWEDYRNGLWDIYALRLTADGLRAPGWPLDGLRLSDQPVDKNGVRILADGSGGAFFVWSDSTLRALRLTGSGEIAPGWVANGRAVCTDSCTARFFSRATDLRIVGDGSGGAFVAWNDTRTWPGSPADPVFSTDIYALRMTGSGDPVPGWPASGRVVTAIPGKVQWNVDMVPDGTGGVLLTWEDYRIVTPAPYMQRLTAAGALAPGWIPDGVRATTSSSYGLGAELVSDTQGGAFLSFDAFVGIDIKAYAQRITGTGQVAPGWNPEGMPLSATPGDQEGSMIVANGVGGAIIAWRDNRPGAFYDIYAQQIGESVPVPVLVSLVSAQAGPDRVILRWFAGEGAGLVANVERRTADTEWRPLDTIAADGTGRLSYEDRSVAPGARYAYRLAYHDDSGPVVTAEVWVQVPALRFSLRGASPNPAVGDLIVSFSLATGGPATLELYDLSGRRLVTREVGSLGPGNHVGNLSRDTHLPAGVYSLRLVQGERNAAVRAVVIR